MKHNLKIAEQQVPVAADLPPPRRKSVSKQMQERFENRKIWRRTLSFAYIALLCVYLGWRFTIINPQSLALSILYYATDVMAFLLSVTSIVIVWDYSHREPPPAPQGKTVDVFVPAYKEPINIIRRTVMAAKAISYPHETWLLDDGKRDELKALAAELGVHYLRRPDNLHAKAGNLNYALKHSTGEFVMSFDADHIAQPHALDVTLGFFADEKVALVQTPQDFYNTEAFQYMPAKRTGGLWHDQSYFYSIMLPTGDAVNGATCVGTGVVYRRSALEHAGGIPTDTVTEDLHTSLKLHLKGYKTVYLNEPIAYGIAAVDLAEFTTTRLRWGHGNLHVLAHEKILTCKGLTFRQRLQYIAMALYYVEGIHQMLLLGIPIISLMTGLQPFTITIFNVLVVTVFPIFAYFVLQEMGCGFSRHWANEIFSMARWPILVRSWAGITQRRIPFRVSSKAMKGKTGWHLMVPQLAVIVLSLAALAAGIYKLDGHYEFGPLFQYIAGIFTGHIPQGVDVHAVLKGGYTLDFIGIAGFWAIYGACRAGYFVWKTWSDARNSHDFFRFKLPLPASIDGAPAGRVNVIAEDWARMDIYPGRPVALGDELAVSVHLPSGPLPLKLRAEKISGGAVEGHLAWEGEAQRDKLAAALYSCDWHREFLTRNAYFVTPSDVLLSCIRLESPFTVKYGEWQAALLEIPAGNPPAEKLYAIAAPLKKDPGRGSLVTFGYFAPGTRMTARLFTAGGLKDAIFDIMEEEAVSSLIQKGLDGATPRRYAIKIVA
jgi:cellulose synthase/poly-beta-1,6-N-acetylglucosamine synthase-like glycosyltransferase